MSCFIWFGSCYHLFIISWEARKASHLERLKQHCWSEMEKFKILVCFRQYWTRMIKSIGSAIRSVSDPPIQQRDSLDKSLQSFKSENKQQLHVKKRHGIWNEACLWYLHAWLPPFCWYVQSKKVTDTVNWPLFYNWNDPMVTLWHLTKQTKLCNSVLKRNS